MRTPRFLALIVAASALLVVTTPPAGATEWMGYYLPLSLGVSWTYENADNPADTFTESVFELIEYEGHPAFRFGADIDNNTILYRDGGIITVYADVENGLLLDLDEDLVLGGVVDGGYLRICFDSPCDTSLIRVWENIAPALRNVYGIGPGPADVIVIANYDRAYPPNLHNVMMESNLPGGVTVPTGAVTELEWYLRGTGMVEMLGVDAASGGTEERYVLVNVLEAGDGLPLKGGLALEGVAPNPFNPRTTIRYRLAEPATVTVEIHDCAGRLVRTLTAGEPLGAGSHTVVWDGADAQGHSLPTGAYFCRILTGDESVNAKVFLVR